MDINDINKKLHNYKYIEFKIDAVNEELRNLASAVDVQRSVKSPVLTGMPSSKNISDPVGDAAERIIDKYCQEYARLENELDKLFTEKHIIEDLLETLNSFEKKIIELKYFKKYKWWMVADTVSYSEKQCRRICKKAIAKIHTIFNS